MRASLALSRAADETTTDKRWPSADGDSVADSANAIRIRCRHDGRHGRRPKWS